MFQVFFGVFILLSLQPAFGYPNWKLYFLFLGLARSFLAIFFEYGVWHGIIPSLSLYVIINLTQSLDRTGFFGNSQPFILVLYDVVCYNKLWLLSEQQQIKKAELMCILPKVIAKME
ncbi:hypothetical protein, partial [Streptococcus danieliae]